MTLTPEELNVLMVAVIELERKRIIEANHNGIMKTNRFISDLQMDNMRLRNALTVVLDDLMYKEHQRVIDLARKVLDNPLVPSTT